MKHEDRHGVAWVCIGVASAIALIWILVILPEPRDRALIQTPRIGAMR